MLLDKGKAQTKWIKRMVFDVGGQTVSNPRKYILELVDSQHYPSANTGWSYGCCENNDFFAILTRVFGPSKFLIAPSLLKVGRYQLSHGFYIRKTKERYKINTTHSWFCWQIVTEYVIQSKVCGLHFVFSQSIYKLPYHKVHCLTDKITRIWSWALRLLINLIIW